MITTAAQKLPKEFYWLTAARLTSTFGMFLNMMVVNIFVLELTGSAMWVGWLMAVRIISGMLFSPYIGQLADKMNRKTLMVVSDFILAFFIFITIFIPTSVVNYYFIWAMLIIGVFSSAVDITLSAAVPSILHSGNTIKANSILMGGRNIVIALAGLSSVFIKEIFSSYNTVFIVNALAYLASGFIIFSLKIKMNEANTQKPAVKQEKKGFFKTMKEDYKDVFLLPNFKVIALMIFILTLDGLASGSHNVGWPIFSQGLNSKNPFFIYGFIQAFWGLGNIIGIFWLTKSSLAKKLRAENLYLICTAIMSLGMIMTVQSTLSVVIFTAACFAGFGDGAYQTFFNTYLQASPDNVRGKLFGLSSTFLRTGFGASFIIMPFLFNAFSVSKVLLYSHGPLVIISLIFLTSLNAGSKQKTGAKN
ncbi:MAG: MFS transporter [Elusimicrobiota bacterium]|jgi:MFS family permease|nr:MFS transporter [Elusimicrobiota bacterium]